MERGWDPYVVSFYRGAIGFLFVLAWLLIRPRGSGLGNLRLWFWSALAGLGVAGNFSFYFVSISEGSVAVAATLMYCAPVIVYLVSFALRLETLSGIKVGAIAVVMLGVVLLTRVHEAGAGGVTPWGLIAGLLAGVSYALFIFSFKYAEPHGSPQAVLVIAFACLLAVLVWPSDPGEMVGALEAPGWPFFIILGVLGAGVSFICYLLGLKHCTPTVASIVAMIEPVTASLFGYGVLNQHLTGGQILGMILILCTVTFMSVHAGPQMQPVEPRE